VIPASLAGVFSIRLLVSFLPSFLLFLFTRFNYMTVRILLRVMRTWNRERRSWKKLRLYRTIAVEPSDGML